MSRLTSNGWADPGARTRPLLPVICLVTGAVLGGPSCGPSNTGLVTLTVSGLTGDYTRLTIMPVLDGGEAPAVEEDLPPFHDATQTYGLYYAADTMGALVLDVIASGGTACLDITARTMVPLAGQDRLDVSVQLTPMCGAPMLSAITPAMGPSTGGVEITLTGANLASRSTVSFGGVAAAGVQVSPTEIRTILPASPGALGRVPVAVTGPDGRSGSRVDLFSYYPGTLDFTREDFTAGANPQSMAIGDVSGDGKPDLVIANQGSNNVSVLLGKGDGSFLPAQSFSTGIGSFSVVIGDVNGDGKPDLSVANLNGGNVSVLLGKGDGSFLPAQSFPVVGGAQSLAIGDVNGDGKPDLAYTGADIAGVLLGKGDGSFLPAQSFSAGIAPWSVAIGDLNGDGKPDLAVAYAGSRAVSVLLGKGDGSFLPAQSFSVGGDPSSVSIAELNADRKPDLVVANRGSGNVSVLLGKGDGTFQGARYFSTNAQPDSVAIGDVNGDSKPDLAVANYGSNDVSVLLGKGDGSFEAPQFFAVAWGRGAVAIRDLNGDNKPDLAVANQSSDNVSVLLNVSR